MIWRWMTKPNVTLLNRSCSALLHPKWKFEYIKGQLHTTSSKMFQRSFGRLRTCRTKCFQFQENYFNLVSVGFVPWHINRIRLFNARPVFFYPETVLFQTIQYSISTQIQCQNSSISNNSFSISKQFKCENVSISNNSV